MRKFNLLVAILIATSANLFAQTDSVKLELDHIFQYVESFKVISLNGVVRSLVIALGY